jgi:hypothetical protein
MKITTHTQMPGAPGPAFWTWESMNLKGACASVLRAGSSQSPRAVGAMVISPALQRGVGVTNNISGVPWGRRILYAKVRTDLTNH